MSFRTSLEFDLERRYRHPFGIVERDVIADIILPEVTYLLRILDTAYVENNPVAKDSGIHTLISAILVGNCEAFDFIALYDEPVANLAE